MNWFRALTGLSDDTPDAVRAAITVDAEGALILPDGRRLWPGVLTCPSLSELHAKTRQRPSAGQTTLRDHRGEAKALHADPAHAGAMFLVASQFNLLEMIAPHVTPEDGIARYSDDPTQGPACAVACGGGTIWRNYFVPVAGQSGQSADRQLDMLADLNAALGDVFEMRNGYALPRPGGLFRAGQVIADADCAARDRLRGLLRVGLVTGAEVTLPGAGHRVSQVYCSALPVAYGSDPVAAWEPVARLVLEAAYEATLRIAMLQPRPAPVFLTRLGGGAFGNRPEWIDAALDRAIGLAEHAGLDLRMVVRG